MYSTGFDIFIQQNRIRYNVFFTLNLFFEGKHSKSRRLSSKRQIVRGNTIVTLKFAYVHKLFNTKQSTMSLIMCEFIGEIL